MILPMFGILVLVTRYRYIPDEAERHKDKDSAERDT